MNILIKGSMFKGLLGVLPESEVCLLRESHCWGVSENEKVRVDISEFSEAALDAFCIFLEGLSVNDRSAKLSLGQVRQWIDIRSDPSGMKVTKLENLPSALKKYLEDNAPHRYLFCQLGDGNAVPYFVSAINYADATKQSPAHVNIALISICPAMGKVFSGEGSSRRGNEGLTLYHADMAGKPLSRILSDKGWYVETSERVESYDREMEKYVSFRGRIGLQMSVSGKASSRSSGWHRSDFSVVERAGCAAKMVIDDEPGESSSTRTEASFWEKKKDLDERETMVWTVPVHPYLYMFDLEEHGFYAVHVDNTEPYVYDAHVGDKLVLPTDVKELLGILIEHTNSSFKDIVEGKAGGAVVLCQGLAGTGKTLTAEVYSEVMNRPLYRVQSHQLGLNAEKVEEKLQEVLGRAERWGAILLLDEADVYVRARGDDLEQNAIVGVFLRVLEYYKGVLFMTTNRGTELDDAIISRVTARISYENPGKEDSRKIWEILSAQNDIHMSKMDIDHLVEELFISGRDIKNLLKLAKMVATRKGVSVTESLIKKLYKFR